MLGETDNECGRATSEVVVDVLNTSIPGAPDDYCNADFHAGGSAHV